MTQHTYATLGYQISGSLLSSNWLANARTATESVIQLYRQTTPAALSNGVSLGQFTQTSPHRNPDIDGSIWLNEPFIIGDLLSLDRRFIALLAEEKLWSFAASLLDVKMKNVIFHYSNLTRKPAGIGPSISWHRDAENTYFCPDDDRFLRLLIPLQGMSEENGGTAVIPESHINRIEKSELDQASILYPELTAGDVLAIHPQLLHGGTPNRSQKERDVLIVQFGISGASFRYQEELELGAMHTLETFRQL